VEILGIWMIGSNLFVCFYKGIECLAIVFGVKKFQKYLYGKEFILQTDHAPLGYLMGGKVENARCMRWAMYLQSYRFRIEVIKGRDNIGADYLSRMDLANAK